MLQAQNQVALCAKPLVFVGGHEENYQDLLANAAKLREQERGRTCSAARTTSTTRVRIKRSEGIPPCRRRPGPYAYPQRIFARKPCTSACERLPVRSLMFGRDFPPAEVASKRRRQKSPGRPPQSLGDRAFGEPFRPEPVVAQGQGRVDCRGRVPGEHPNPRLRP